MPTPITHLIVSLPINQSVMKRNNNKKVFLFSILAAGFADIDYIAYLYGVPETNFFGHRAFTHSFFFSFVFALTVCVIFFREIKFKSKSFFLLLINFFFIASSHSILDFLVNKNSGAALFSPFIKERIIFAYAPIAETTTGVIAYFQNYLWLILKVEFFYIIMPALIIYFFLFKKLKNY